MFSVGCNDAAGLPETGQTVELLQGEERASEDFPCDDPPQGFLLSCGAAGKPLRHAVGQHLLFLSQVVFSEDPQEVESLLCLPAW